MDISYCIRVTPAILYAMKQYACNKLLIFQSIVFGFIALTFIIPNGNFSCSKDLCTLSIGEWHMHDALWHISLAKLGFGSWPLQNPFMTGQVLSGYNFLLDYILYLLTKIGISPFLSFFKILPILATTLYIWSTCRYIKSVTISPVKANLLAFFLYFGSSATYIATLYAGHTFYYASLRGFPVVSVINPTTMFLNLQFAFSLSLILWIMMLIKQESNKVNACILALLFFLLFGFKFYGGIIGLFLLLTQKNKIFSLRTMLAVLGSYFGLFVFYGIGIHSKLPFTWAPLSLTRLLIDDPLLFYNHGLTLARAYLYEHNPLTSPRLWAIEGLGVILFITLNFGTRLLGLLYAAKEKRHLGILGIIGVTTLIPILFVQDGGWYNTMQFLYYGTWLSGILMADFTSDLLDHKSKLTLGIFLGIIALTIPNAIEQIRFLTAPQNVVSSDELTMLQILKNAPYGVVHSNDPEHRRGLVPALAEKPAYFMDTDQLMVTHANYQDRLDFIHKYSGGSITTVPANYYLIYKQEWGTLDSIKALTSPTQYKRIYSSAKFDLYQKL